MVIDEAPQAFDLDPEFQKQEKHLVQEALDGLNNLIKFCEDPRSIFGRRALLQLTETLPLQTSHLLRRQ